MVVAHGAALYFVSSHIRYRSVYRFAVPVDHPFVCAWLDRNQLRLRKIRVKTCADISAPITYGLFRPQILLPKITDWTNSSQLQYVLTQELTHIRRFDIIWKWLLVAAACVHWFNPLVWVMYVLANQDLEITCDEKVIRTLGEQSKAPYALTLIELAEEQAKLLPVVNAFSKHAIEERMMPILKSKKISLLGFLTAAALVVSLTIVTAFAVDPSSQRDMLGEQFASQLSAHNFLPEEVVADLSDFQGGQASDTTQRYLWRGWDSDQQAVTHKIELTTWHGRMMFYQYQNDAFECSSVQTALSPEEGAALAQSFANQFITYGQPLTLVSDPT